MILICFDGLDFGQVIPTVMPHGKVWWVTGGRLLIGALAFAFSLDGRDLFCSKLIIQAFNFHLSVVHVRGLLELSDAARQGNDGISGPEHR